MRPKPLTPQAAVAKAGSATALARMFNPPVTRQAVQGWVNRGEIPGAKLWELTQICPQWFTYTKAAK